ncbi:unnamed protein product [Symbiodinium microadriaticum]|nr:unnamed protein product [Symbiodinium microadriaticum]
MRLFLIVASYLLHACQADANNLVMMYKASEKECGQALLKESWVFYAKRFAGLRVGSCPGEGYTVVTKKMNMKVPVVGFTVRVQMYKKDFHHVGKAQWPYILNSPVLRRVLLGAPKPCTRNP